jgi:hypothetical protein
VFYTPITVGAIIASAWTGLMLPTLLAWAIAQRGRGTCCAPPASSSGFG